MVVAELGAAVVVGEIKQTHPMTPLVREWSSWCAAIERSKALPITGERGKGLFCSFHYLPTYTIYTTDGRDNPDVVADTYLTVWAGIAEKGGSLSPGSPYHGGSRMC
jgi:hypothetical protein